MVRWPLLLGIALFASAAHADDPCPAECQRRESEELSQYVSNLSLVPGNSCDSVAKLRQLAVGKRPSVAKLYVDEADRRQRAGLNAARDELDQGVRSAREKYDATFFATFEQHTDDVAPHDALETLSNDAEALRCYDRAAADRGASDVKTLSDEIDALRAAENTCRKTPACMAERVRGPLCQLVLERRLVQQQIAEERANPGGVVDLVRLHDLGQELQSVNAALPQWRAAYVKYAKKALDERSCK